MHVILFGLGLVLSSAGLAAIAYGFREIEFTVGTTMISAGTIAGTGGLILIGLAAVVYQLRQIRQSGGMQNVAATPQPVRDATPVEPQVAASVGRGVPVPAAAKIPFPPKPVRDPARVAELRAPEPRGAEPRGGDLRGADLRGAEPRVPEVRAAERVVEPLPDEPPLGGEPDPIFGDMLGQAASEFPPEPRISEPRMPEPRLEPRAPDLMPKAAPPVAAPSVAASARPVEPPMVEESDEVSLSPRPPSKVQLRHAPASPLTRSRATNLNTAPTPVASPVASPATTSAPAEEARAETTAPANAPTNGEREQPAINFDSLWPAADKRPGRPQRDASRNAPPTPPAPFVERRGGAVRRDVERPEPPRRTVDANARAEAPHVDGTSAEPSSAEPVRAPTGRVEPPALRVEPTPARTEPSPVRNEPYVPGTEPPALRIESEPPAPTSPSASAPTFPAAKSGEPRAIAILKSGVVDGMAYTLYADGSIEAQLPAGTLRFDSIAELREHIEKNS